MSLIEKCSKHYKRLVDEGWKVISIKDNKAVLQSPDNPEIFKAIYLLNDTHTYKIDNVDSQAYEGESANAADFDAATTEFTAGDYAKIDGDDNEFAFHRTSTYNYYQFHRFDTAIDEDVGSITQVDITIKGYGWAVTLYGYYLYVKESGTWTQKDSHTGSSDQTLTAQYTENFSTIVSSGHIHWGVRSPKAVGQLGYLYSYYGEVVVSYTAVTAPTVTTQAATNVEATSATGNGNITDTGGENCTVRGFKYGLTETDTWDVHDSGSFGAGTFSKGITGLSPGTTYYIRAYATNSAGTGYGAYVEFTTELETGAKDLSNTLQVRKAETNDLGQSLKIRGVAYKNLNQTLISIQSDQKDLLNKLVFRKSTYNNLSGYLSLRRSASKDLSQTLVIRKGAYSDLSGELKIRTSSYSNLLHTLLIRKIAYNDLLGTLANRISATEDLSGMLIIKSSTYKDLSGTLLFRKSSYTTLNGELSLRQVATKDLLNTLLLRKITGSNILQSLHIGALSRDLKHILCVGRTGGKTLGNIVIIRKSTYDSLIGTLTLRKAAYVGLSGTLTARRRAYRNLGNALLLRSFSSEELSGTLLLRQSSSSDLSGTLYFFRVQYSGLRAYINNEIKELCLVDKGESQDGLRICKNGTIYDIYLVDISNEHASPIYIKTPKGVKSIRYKT